MSLKQFILSFFFLLGLNTSCAQLSHHTRGFLLSYYDQKIANYDLDKDYLYRSMSLSVSQKSRLFALPFIAATVDFQTQLGVTNLANNKQSEFLIKGIEAAFLMGLNVEISFVPDYWWLYVGGSIGPQFISNSVSRQKKGFIFSDSIYAGSRFYLGKGKQLDLKVGYRHQSNAGISEPNGGIDALFISGGVLVNLKN